MVDTDFKIDKQILKTLHWKSKKLTELLGYTCFIKLSELYGGKCVYFPKITDIVKEAKEKAICKEYDGSNLREVARKYGYTVLGIKKILWKNKISINPYRKKKGGCEFEGLRNSEND